MYRKVGGIGGANPFPPAAAATTPSSTRNQKKKKDDVIEPEDESQSIRVSPARRPFGEWNTYEGCREKESSAFRNFNKRSSDPGDSSTGAESKPSTGAAGLGEEEDATGIRQGPESTPEFIPFSSSSTATTPASQATVKVDEQFPSENWVPYRDVMLALNNMKRDESTLHDHDNDDDHSSITLPDSFPSLPTGFSSNSSEEPMLPVYLERMEEFSRQIRRKYPFWWRELLTTTTTTTTPTTTNTCHFAGDDAATSEEKEEEQEGDNDFFVRVLEELVVAEELRAKESDWTAPIDNGDQNTAELWNSVVKEVVTKCDEEEENEESNNNTDNSSHPLPVFLNRAAITAVMVELRELAQKLQRTREYDGDVINNRDAPQAVPSSVNGVWINCNSPTFLDLSAGGDEDLAAKLVTCLDALQKTRKEELEEEKLEAETMLKEKSGDDRSVPNPSAIGNDILPGTTKKGLALIDPSIDAAVFSSPHTRVLVRNKTKKESDSEEVQPQQEQETERKKKKRRGPTQEVEVINVGSMWSDAALCQHHPDSHRIDAPFIRQALPRGRGRGGYGLQAGPQFDQDGRIYSSDTREAATSFRTFHGGLSMRPPLRPQTVSPQVYSLPKEMITGKHFIPEQVLYEEDYELSVLLQANPDSGRLKTKVEDRRKEQQHRAPHWETADSLLIGEAISDKFQWLPCELLVSKKQKTTTTNIQTAPESSRGRRRRGRTTTTTTTTTSEAPRNSAVEIRSYIPGVEPAQHHALYRLLEEAFQRGLSALEFVLGELETPELSHQVLSYDKVANSTHVDAVVERSAALLRGNDKPESHHPSNRDSSSSCFLCMETKKAVVKLRAKPSGPVGSITIKRGFEENTTGEVAEGNPADEAHCDEEESCCGEEEAEGGEDESKPVDKPTVPLTEKRTPSTSSSSQCFSSSRTSSSAEVTDNEEDKNNNVPSTIKKIDLDGRNLQVVTQCVKIALSPPTEEQIKDPQSTVTQDCRYKYEGSPTGLVGTRNESIVATMLLVLEEENVTPARMEFFSRVKAWAKNTVFKDSRTMEESYRKLFGSERASSLTPSTLETDILKAEHSTHYRKRGEIFLNDGAKEVKRKKELQEEEFSRRIAEVRHNCARIIQAGWRLYVWNRAQQLSNEAGAATNSSESSRSKKNLWDVALSPILNFLRKNRAESRAQKEAAMWREIVRKKSFTDSQQLPLSSIVSSSPIMPKVIVFPNTLETRIAPFELQDRTKPGCLTILAFHVVHPKLRIISTLHVPVTDPNWQKRSWVRLLRHLFGNNHDVAWEIATYLLYDGSSLKEDGCSNTVSAKRKKILRRQLYFERSSSCGGGGGSRGPGKTPRLAPLI